MTATTTRPDERRGFWIAAGVMTTTVVVLVALFVAVYPDDGTDGGPPPSTTATGAADGPGIVIDPSEGVAPDDPGDPGGWQQVALLGLLVAGMGTVGALAWRSSRRARTRAAANGTPPPF